MTATIDFSRGRRRNSSGGFTLLELLVAMLAASVLLAGLSSALFLTIQATQPDVGGHDSTLRGSQALVDLSGELRFAKAFTLRTDKAVEFTVADRSGEGDDETIRWQWSGVAGDPLTRQYNGGTVVDVLDNVHDFQLSYNIKSLTTTQQGSGSVTSDEFMWANFEGWPGVSPSTGTAPIGVASWIAEYFQAQGLPADLTSMSVTKVSLRLQKFLGGTLQVGIHKAIGGGNVEPMPTPIGAPVNIDVATLPASVAWVDIPLTGVTLNELESELVIVVKATANNAAFLEYYNDRKAPADTTVMVSTTDGGSSWSPSASKRNENDALFRAYGTYTTVGDGEIEVTRYFVVSGNGAVQVGSATSNRRETETEILNRPETLAP